MTPVIMEPITTQRKLRSSHRKQVRATATISLSAASCDTKAEMGWLNPMAMATTALASAAAHVPSVVAQGTNMAMKNNMKSGTVKTLAIL